MIDATELAGVAGGSGIGTYTRNLLAALAERDDVEAVALCAGDVALPGGVHPYRVGRPTRALMPSRARAHVIEQALRIPIDARRARRDGEVFHNPSYHAPMGVAAPWVQTLLDVIPLVYDAPDQAVLRARWKRFGPRYRQASAVVAISHHAAKEGARVLGLDPARIHVAHLGVDPIYLNSGNHPATTEHEHPYLLVVSEYSQRKGFAEAFELCDRLVDSGYPHRLRVAGRVHAWGADQLARLHASARHPERIEILGFVDDLVALYKGASCFIMSSRYEGFGLPALEAMACGVPVVAFDNSSVTEVVGGGGQLVADGDLAAMVDAVRAIVDQPSTRAAWIEQGLAHAAKFTWAAAAAGHVEAYRDAADRARAG